MKRLLVGALAVWAAGGFGLGVATAEPGYQPDNPAPSPSPVGDDAPAKVVYAVGGARPPGIPWRMYAGMAGAKYFPNTSREIVDYPAAAAFSWVPDIFAPGPRDNMSIGESVRQGADDLDQDVRRGAEPAAAVGLSQGALALEQERVRLAGDPTAPPSGQLQFATFGDPAGTHAFGKSFLAGIFPPGSYIPVVDYTMPQPVESQYDTNRIVAAYDAIADFPDRPDNLLADANAIAGAAIVHTTAAFTSPDDVPPQNIRTTVNSRGATETTHFIPIDHLPLTLPLRYLGWSDSLVDQIDGVLQPQIDAGYSRNDDVLTKPVSVDPVAGMDPIAVLDPATRESAEKTISMVRGFLPAPPGLTRVIGAGELSGIARLRSAC